MSLPTDVVDHIFSFLQSDPEVLETCAQSHPILSKLAERYIYVDIVIGSDYRSTWGCKPQRTSEFIQIITERPDIVFHVRSLTIHIYDEDERCEVVAGSHLDTLASIMPLFSGLTKIGLVGNSPWSWSHGVSWQTVPETFLQAFLQVLRLQGMKGIYFYDVGYFPLALLNNCNNIRVTLRNCQQVQYDKESMERLSSPMLEHLSVRHCEYTSMENVTAWVQNNIKSLMIGIFYDVKDLERVLPQLFKACSNSLMALELDIYNYDLDRMFFPNFGTDVQNDAIHFPFTLADFFRIERFTFAHPCMSLYRTDAFEPSITAITRLLHNAPPTLKEVYLKFKFEFTTFPDDEDIWSPFIPLAAKCSSLSIRLKIRADIRVTRSSGRQPPSDILSSIAGCAELMSYVGKGLFVIVVDPFLEWDSSSIPGW